MGLRLDVRPRPFPCPDLRACAAVLLASAALLAAAPAAQAQAGAVRPDDRQRLHRERGFCPVEDVAWILAILGQDADEVVTCAPAGGPQAELPLV